MLQELEKIVIVSFKKDDPVVSGEFSLVSHIGGLVPRFIYAPLEEVSFNLFAKFSSSESLKDQDEEHEEFIAKKKVIRNGSMEF